MKALAGAYRATGAGCGQGGVTGPEQGWSSICADAFGPLAIREEAPLLANALPDYGADGRRAMDGGKIRLKSSGAFPSFLRQRCASAVMVELAI